MYINYAGIILSDLLEVRSVEIPSLPDRENISINIPSRYGEIYNGFRYNTREITIDFLIKADNQIDYAQCVSDIANALDVNAPSRLYLNDTVRYFYAVHNGTLSINEIAANVGEGQIKFMCYDPMQYSDDYKMFTGTKTIDVVNNGTTETYPIIRTNITKPAAFVQVSDSDTGASVLIGSYPIAGNDTTQEKGDILTETCETTTDWLSAGNVVDSDRLVEGAITINSGGYGVKANNFGTTTNQKWHGPAVRRNIGSNIQDFEVIATFEHDSKGKNVSNAANTPPSTSSNGIKYEVTPKEGLNVREGRGTKYKVLTTMPKGTKVSVTEISGGWGKVTYNSKTGYSSMQYLKQVTNTSATHKTTANLNLRSTRSTSGKILLTIPKGTSIKVTDIKSGWGAVTYNNKSGYVSTQYLSVLKTVARDDIQMYSNETADDKLGIIELYGFDSNNQKLFKLSLKDVNSYYEYTHPEVQIGNNVVLKDNESVPAPKTHTEKNDKGENKTVTDLSGKFGKWNEFYGNIKIKRKTVNGKQQWYCEVNKIVNGKVTATLKSSNLVSGSYPKGSLNHVVLYMGAYQDKPTVEMTLTHLQIKSLNKIPTESNVNIFKAGDELVIDCKENKVLLNDVPCMDYVDIGSSFFKIPVGNSTYRIISDDADITSSVTLTERWL